MRWHVTVRTTKGKYVERSFWRKKAADRFLADFLTKGLGTGTVHK